MGMACAETIHPSVDGMSESDYERMAGLIMNGKRSETSETATARVEIARCPCCGRLPRPTLLGRAICDNCGGLDVPQPPSQKVLEQAAEVLSSKTDCGHGHVFPRPDGYKARCGGPTLCQLCSRDQEIKQLRSSKQCAEPTCQERATAYDYCAAHFWNAEIARLRAEIERNRNQHERTEQDLRATRDQVSDLQVRLARQLANVGDLTVQLQDAQNVSDPLGDGVPLYKRQSAGSSPARSNPSPPTLRQADSATSFSLLAVRGLADWAIGDTSMALNIHAYCTQAYLNGCEDGRNER
jgi:hypothetical protein